MKILTRDDTDHNTEYVTRREAEEEIQQLKDALHASHKDRLADADSHRAQVKTLHEALTRLDGIYRHDLDHPGFRPEWLRDALSSHNAEVQPRQDSPQTNQ